MSTMQMPSLHAFRAFAGDAHPQIQRPTPAAALAYPEPPPV
jgi:hypothetical protein